MTKKAPSPRLRVISVQSPQSMEVSIKQDERHPPPDDIFVGIDLDFIRPDKPVENAFIESITGRLQEECLSQNWFVDLDDAQAALAAWREGYNMSRPHTSRGGLAPVEYVAPLLAGAEREETV